MAEPHPLPPKPALDLHKLLIDLVQGPVIKLTGVKANERKRLKLDFLPVVGLCSICGFKEGRPLPKERRQVLKHVVTYSEGEEVDLSYTHFPLGCDFCSETLAKLKKLMDEFETIVEAIRTVIKLKGKEKDFVLKNEDDDNNGEIQDNQVIQDMDWSTQFDSATPDIVDIAIPVVECDIENDPLLISSSESDSDFEAPPNATEVTPLSPPVLAPLRRQCRIVAEELLNSLGPDEVDDCCDSDADFNGSEAVSDTDSHDDDETTVATTDAIIPTLTNDANSTQNLPPEVLQNFIIVQTPVIVTPVTFTPQVPVNATPNDAAPLAPRPSKEKRDRYIHPSISKPHQCNICKKSYATIYPLREHYGKAHGLPAPAVQANKNKKKRKRDVDVDENIILIKQKPHQCEICKKRFSTANFLSFHIDDQHSNGSSETMDPPPQPPPEAAALDPTGLQNEGGPPQEKHFIVEDDYSDSDIKPVHTTDESDSDSDTSGGKNKSKKKKSKEVNCSVCEIPAHNAAALEQHLKSYWHYIGVISRRTDDAISKLTFTCPIKSCGIGRFFGFRSLKDHLEIKHCDPIKCEECESESTFSNTRQYAEHLVGKVHLEKVGEPKDVEKEIYEKNVTKCEICDKSCLTLWALEVHKKAEHPVQFSRICEVCGVSLASLQSFKHHSALHEKGWMPGDKPKQFVPPSEKPLKCPLCEKRFAHKRSLQIHTNVEHKKMTFSCDICHAEFDKPNRAWSHKNKVHGSGSAATRPQQDSNKIQYTCDFCPHRIVGKSHLSMHVELMHLIPGKMRDCPWKGCGSRFESEEEWKGHLAVCNLDKSVTGQTRCTFCREVFPNQILKLIHQLQTHKTHQCDHCARSFTNLDVLNKHRIMSHKENPKDFLCPKCGKSFRQNWNLKVHLTTICGDDEEAKKKYEEKRRQQNAEFREKAFKCSECPKRFVDRERLNMHVEKEHDEEEEDSFDSDSS